MREFGDQFLHPTQARRNRGGTHFILLVECYSSSLLITRLGRQIKMRVNATPGRTRTHKDLGRIRIHKRII